MAKMSVVPPGELKQFLDAQVAEEGFISGNEHSCDVIRRQLDLEHFRKLLIEGASSGPTRPMESGFFEQMRARARSRPDNL